MGAVALVTVRFKGTSIAGNARLETDVQKSDSEGGGMDAARSRQDRPRSKSRISR